MKENEIELPDQAQRWAIWKMIMEKFALPDDSNQDLLELIERINNGRILNVKEADDEFEFYDHIRELYQFHQAFDALKNNQKELTEVRVYLGEEMIAFKHPETLKRLYTALATHPISRPRQEPPKRPRGNSFSSRGAMLEYGVNNCIEFVDKFRPDLVQKEKLYFAGLVLSMAGMVENPITFIEKEGEFDYKEKITKQLAYYTK